MGMNLAETIIYEWKNDPQIREEFKTISAYAQFRYDQAAGRCRIIGGTVITAPRLQMEGEKNG